MKIQQSMMAILIAGAMICCASETRADPDVFVIDNDHTHIVWSVDRFGFTKTIGTFADIDGTLVLDQDDPEMSKVNAVISLSGLRSDLEERENIVRSPHWLDASKFPVIKFESRSVTIDEETTDHATIMGQLSVKGVTAPVSFDAKLNKIGTDPVTKRTAIGFSGAGTLKRSDFGVDIALGPVGGDVHFNIELLAVLEAAD